MLRREFLRKLEPEVRSFIALMNVKQDVFMCGMFGNLFNIVFDLQQLRRRKD
jgi:hypothetical protein